MMKFLAGHTPIQKAGLLAAGAFLLVGASTPSSCSPKPTTPPAALSSLYGPTTSGGIGAAPAGTTCPLVGDPDFPNYRGDPEKWGQRIKGVDPTEWLTLNVCASSLAKLSDGLDGGFVIYTASGELRGTFSGSRFNDIDPVTFHVALTATSGKGSFKGAHGSLGYVGCLDGQKILAGRIQANTSGGLPAACAPRGDFKLSALEGPLVKGGTSTPDASLTCPPVDPGDGRPAAPGVRTKWSQGIAAYDPKEWLSINACGNTNAGGHGGFGYTSGFFTIYTATGKVTGTVTGIYRYALVDNFTFTLTATGGTGAWSGTHASLTYVACVAPNGVETAGQLVQGEISMTCPAPT